MERPRVMVLPQGGSDEHLCPSGSNGSEHGKNMEWPSLRKRIALFGLSGARKGASWLRQWTHIWGKSFVSVEF